MNPYKVLGIREDATQEEIRAAYLALVKKYHPDKYTDNPLKDLANEKIKEINEAYEILTKRGLNASRPPEYQASQAYGSYSGSGSAYSGSYASDFSRVRTLLNERRLQEAKQLLEKIPVRNAEWYYLYGIVHYRMGYYDRAREYLSRAYEQEPGNVEYRHAYSAVQNAGSPYGRYYTGGGNNFGSDCSCCDLCGALMCIRCC